ncbi:hypothetical protein L596_012562 [Steinernema carpocapsae]|uniref:G-protein coupled receptors family 1 profile domain-containing protein n=1 Tax=Steinernema carpocapsae TaxID=34508 RepID=A0A4U5NY19_STECR|nr:hypothetical protein L596_012562 [Steinernema carpocapsae]
MPLAYASLISNILIAINRYCIVAVPLKYKILFTAGKTRVLIGITFFVSVALGTPTFLPYCVNQLEFPYGSLTGNYTAYQEFFCLHFTPTMDSVLNIFFTVLTLTVDLLTLKKLGEISKDRNKIIFFRPLKTEHRLCRMIICQQIVSCLSGICSGAGFFFVDITADEDYFLFKAWAFNTMLDGLVVMLFTPDFFKFDMVARIWPCNEISSNVNSVDKRSQLASVSKNKL